MTRVGIRVLGVGISGALLIGGPAASAAGLSAPTPPAAPAASDTTSVLEREFWAGVSYRDALLGLAVLGSGGAVIALLTRSVVATATATVAAAVTYFAYDPGATGIVSPDDLPRMSYANRKSAGDH